MFQKILDKILEWLNGKPLSDADLVAELKKKAEGTGLNWEVSVVDFLKLLGIDSSGTGRELLAEELGLPSNLVRGTAEKNEALRVAVFKKLAENGGNIPASLIWN